MGRGQIIAHLGDGQYSVRLNYAYRDRVNQKLAILSGQIAELDIRIAAETDASRLSTLNLQRAAAQRMYDYYSTRMPADPSVDAWCADLTEDIAYGTVVGTIEIPGEATTVLVRPAYDNRAVYSAPRDGQLMPSIAGEPNQVLFNWMMLPGWQRHKPIYRSGTIVSDSLDFDANTCSVCLDPAYSSQQSLPAIDGATVADCNMGDDSQSSSLTARAADFCSRNPSHPFCTQSAGSEVYLSPQMLADLQTVNGYVNTNYGRQGDQSGLRSGDSWDVMAPGGAGDCEDFALTKMQRLVSNYGFDPDSLKMVTAYTQNGDYHAMLGVRTTNRGLVLLDVNYNEVMDNARLPYRLDKIAMTWNDWRNYTRRLDAVPIEYMSCNAFAFADGDRVVVEFQGQNWTNPKVVGFMESPKPCTANARVFGNEGFGSGDWSHYYYDHDAAVWFVMGEIPGNTYGGEPSPWIMRQGIFTTGDRSNFYLFGGLDKTHQDDDCPLNPNLPECVSGCYPSIYDRSDKYARSGAAWSVLADMPLGRAHGKAFRIGQKSYIPSGSTHLGYGIVCEPPAYLPITTFLGGESKNDLLAFDEVAGTWALKSSHPVGRIFGTAFTLNGIGFSFGGALTAELTYGDFYDLPSLMAGYDPAADTWQSYQNMSRGRLRFGAGAINGVGVIFGGSVYVGQSGDEAALINGQPGFSTYWAEAYNATTDTWSNVVEITPKIGATTGDVAECGTYGLGHIFGSSNWGKFDGITNTATQLVNMYYEGFTIYPRFSNRFYLNCMAAQ